jgi:hypothetical protein
VNDLVVTSAAAQIAGPAGSTWLLRVDVSIRQPSLLFGSIYAIGDITHGAELVVDETMACKQPAFGRDAQITPARAARIGIALTSMYLPQRVDHV